jgi:HSP20 family protein
LFDNSVGLGSGIDSLFEDLLNRPWARSYSQVPAIDVAEYEHELVVVAELPGVKKEDIKILVQDGVLALSGERKGPAAPEESRWIRTEIASGSFSRSVELPVPVKEDSITAELKNGVLRVVLPKSDRARPREIQVN